MKLEFVQSSDVVLVSMDSKHEIFDLVGIQTHCICPVFYRATLFGRKQLRLRVSDTASGTLRRLSNLACYNAREHDMRIP